MIRSLSLIFLLSYSLAAATYDIDKAGTKSWRPILNSIGLTETSDAQTADILVAGTDASPELLARSTHSVLVLQGISPATQALGIQVKPKPVIARQSVDKHAPDMRIYWQQPQAVPDVGLPADWNVFASEKWTGAPLLAGKRNGEGAILWMAVTPGDSGFERFPYLLQALTDLGVTPPAAASNLWAFFDSSYRIRADPDYLASRWRKAGVGALHVAGWHNMEPDAAADKYLAEVIAACHRHAILVYAWFELPHVSEKFWAAHPEWREKTAVDQDAQLDWRKLMNLQNEGCRHAVAATISNLLDRFDWDGVNLAELYFESLEGASNAARFTPMNSDVRAEFAKLSGFDPQLLFTSGSAHNAAAHPDSLRQFLEFRAALAARMQAEWLDVIDQSKRRKPYLDTVLTHIDDRFEPGIRNALGADVARTIPLVDKRSDTLLVEDPATLWALGPERYSELAAKYREITTHPEHLAVDINVVERYQDVYPTKKQTGVELYQLLHQASTSFRRVALYFENSVEKQDLALLPAAATTARVSASSVDELTVSAPEITRVAWQGPVEVDGKVWPVQDSRYVYVPAGTHRLSAAVASPKVMVRDYNGTLLHAVAHDGKTEISYQDKNRTIAVLDKTPSAIELDGAPFIRPSAELASRSVTLPPGQHVVAFIP